MNYHPEIFEPYDRLVEITICGERHMVPENNSILRCLQFLDMDRISNADLCWNGECLNCQVTVIARGKEKFVMACRTKIKQGITITNLSESLKPHE